MADIQLLRDPEIAPSAEVIKIALGENFRVYEEFMRKVSDCGLTAEWNYYRDGKAWLCKVINSKKKTIFWLSIWDGFFKTSFIFTLKNCSGIDDLNISDSIKENFAKGKNAGKFLPLILDIRQTDQLKDFLQIVEYKKALK